MSTEKKDKLRLDKYLWSIRLFKTRSLAAAACDSGKVKQDGNPIKAAKQVHVGDEYDVRTEGRLWRIKVTGLLHNRMAYSEAIKYYTDITPPEELERLKLSYQASSFHTGKRLSKVGRPTKKERRDLDEFMD
jgi:ribosome-associated heat shock protein Hsp15